MEEHEEIGKFVKVTKKPIRDKSKKIVDWDISYNLLTHSDVVNELIPLNKGMRSFDPKIGMWLKFAGTHWQYYTDDEEMSDFLEVFRKETVHPYGGGFQESFFVSTLRLLRYDRRIFLSKPTDNFINFQNGVVDIEKIGQRGDICPATPDNSQTWCLPYNYVPTAWPNFFLSWLRSVLGDDKGKEQFIRAMINAIITGKTVQVFVHLKGKPRAGKGTLTRFIQMLLDQSSIVNADLETLGGDKFEMGRIYEKKLIILNEQAAYTDLRVLNMITGQDLLTSRTKHGNKSFDFENKAFVLMIGNNPLYLTKAEAAPIAERYRPIIFDRTIPAKDRAEFKKNGGEERLKEDLCGVLHWALKMTDDEVYQTLLDPPSSIVAAGREAEKEGNGLVAWISEEIVYAEGAKTYIGTGQHHKRKGTDRFGTDPDVDDNGPNAKLFPRYLYWCSIQPINNHLKKNDFKSSLIDTACRIFKTENIYAHRDGDGVHIANIRFKTDIEKYEDESK